MFIVFILTALLFLFPLAEFLPADLDHYSFKFNKIIQDSNINPIRYASTFEVGALIAVISLMSLIIIFLYKKRTIQMRLCLYNTILLVALAVIIVIYSILAVKDLEAKFMFKFASAFILISIILSILAFIKIRQDEQLIRGLDRIR